MSFIEFISEAYDIVPKSTKDIESLNLKNGSEILQLYIELKAILKEQEIIVIQKTKSKIPSGKVKIFRKFLNKEEKLKGIIQNNLNLFEKGKIFGNGSAGNSKGRSGITTSKRESLQCVILGLLASGYDPIPENYSKVSNYKINEKISNLFDISPEWVFSAESGAKKLLKEFPEMKSMTFHRKSSMVDIIEEKFKELKKETIFDGISMDKWNPADIWCFSFYYNESNLKKELSNINSIKDFNDYLMLKFSKNEIIPVSLKKIESNNPPIKIYNIDKNSSKIIFSGVGLGDKNDYKQPIKTTYIYFIMDNKKRKIQLRSFQGDKMSNYAAEIIGVTSMGGRVGYGQISNILKEVYKIELPKHGTLVKLIEKKDKKIIQDLFKNIENIFGRTSKNEFNHYINNTKDVFLYNKYIGYKIASALKSGSKYQNDNFISMIANFAQSTTNLSSIFVKIGN